MKKLAAFFACLLLLSGPAWVQAQVPGASLSLGPEKLAKAKGQAIRVKVPGMDKVQVASMAYAPDRGLEVYYPEGYDFSHPEGFVILFNGIADEEQVVADDGAPFKDLGMTVSWALAIAASGLPAVTYDSFEPAQAAHSPPASTAKVLAYLRDRAGVLGLDPGRIGFFVLGHVARNLQLALADPQAGWGPELRGAVFNWPVVDTAVLPTIPFPILVVKPDRAGPGIRFALDDWVAALSAKGYPVEVHRNPSGSQSYELINDNEDTRRAVARILDFLTTRLH